MRAVSFSVFEIVLSRRRPVELEGNQISHERMMIVVYVLSIVDSHYMFFLCWYLQVDDFSSTSSTGGSSSLSSGALAGIVIGGIAGAGILGMVGMNMLGGRMSTGSYKGGGPARAVQMSGRGFGPRGVL